MLRQLLGSSAIVAITLSTFLFSTVSTSPSDGWHFDQVYTLVAEQMDPIVSPNAQGGHMHRVVGGSSFKAAYNFDAARASNCSSVGIQADKSNYWQPQLYWINSPTSFTPLDASIRFYYFMAPNNNVDPVIPFPDGLRILTGNPSSKTANPENYDFICQVNKDRSGEQTGWNFNFARDCPLGMKTNLFLQSCWNGKDLWLAGNAHMAFPLSGNGRNGACPYSHPVRVPAVMLEYTWLTQNYKPGVALKGKLAWANGDTTGYGIHGDFVNGWDRAILSKAMNTTGCVNTNTAISATDCPILKAQLNNAAALTCTPAVKLAEAAGNTDLITLKTLPGCNPLWGNTATKPNCSSYPQYNMNPYKGTDGSKIAIASQRMDRVLPTSPGWLPLGCIGEISSFISPVSYFWPKNLTQEGCMQQCTKMNYAYAGVGGHADNCVCAKGIVPKAPIMTGLCTAPCPGDAKQTCGTSYAYNIYGSGPGTTVSTPITHVNVQRSLYIGDSSASESNLIQSSAGDWGGRMIKRLKDVSTNRV